MNKSVVVDTSIVVKWIVPVPDSHIAAVIQKRPGQAPLGPQPQRVLYRLTTALINII